MDKISDVSAPPRHVTIYTDGACIGNPGPGGYAAVLLFNGKRKEIFGGYRLTTNNRMEMLAAIEALAALREPCRATLHSDSRYLVDAVEKGWAEKWREKGWMRNKTGRAKNPDLWERLLNLLARIEVRFVWVEGHAGNPENERCDQLSNGAAKLDFLPPDEEYERQKG